jgi:signal transduction histidine kinase
MKTSPVPTTMGVNLPPRNAASVRLSGRWLLVKAVWIVLAGGAFVMFVISIPGRFIQLNQPPAVVQTNLTYLGLPVGFYAVYNLLLEVAFIGCFLALALFIFWRKSDEPMALFLALFLVAFGVTLPPTVYVLASYPAWQVAITSMNVLGWVSLNLFGLLFPTGRFVPHWVRWLPPWFILYVLLWHLPGVLPFHPSHWPSPLLALVEISVGGIIAGAQVYRYRNASTPQQRQQIKWVAFGTVGGMGLYIAANVLLPELFPAFTQDGSVYDMFINPLLSCGVLLIPVSLATAILRYRLWDIDIIINRTLVYGGLTVSITSIYVVVVVWLGTVFRAQGNLLISLLATSLVAVLFQPLRERLQRVVNRLMYGERDTPYKVISHLGQRLEATLAPEAVLPTIVETVAHALKLPYAAITLQQDGESVIAASYGSAKNELVRLPLSYQGELIGELVLAPRGPGESFAPADRALLDDLARQAGVAAHAVRLTMDLQHLTSELQQSRTQLVTTREEERRRLRRDLHDGLGPTLGAITLAVGSARFLYTRDAATADALMGKLERDVAATVTEIRRLVYALRPPVLDEHGLVAAIRECAAQYRTPGGDPSFALSIHAPEHLPSLPAAVEVAAYRIAQEALTNVARHARAQTCVVCLALSDVLQLEIKDDGIGLSKGQHMGVGLHSMRERAMELGGTCEVQRLPAGGTRVIARLPLPHEMRSPEHDEPGEPVDP